MKSRFSQKLRVVRNSPRSTIAGESHRRGKEKQVVFRAVLEVAIGNLEPFPTKTRQKRCRMCDYGKRIVTSPRARASSIMGVG